MSLLEKRIAELSEEDKNSLLNLMFEFMGFSADGVYYRYCEDTTVCEPGDANYEIFKKVQLGEINSATKQEAMLQLEYCLDSSKFSSHTIAVVKVADINNITLIEKEYILNIIENSSQISSEVLDHKNKFDQLFQNKEVRFNAGYGYLKLKPFDKMYDLTKPDEKGE